MRRLPVRRRAKSCIAREQLKSGTRFDIKKGAIWLYYPRARVLFWNDYCKNAAFVHNLTTFVVNMKKPDLSVPKAATRQGARMHPDGVKFGLVSFFTDLS